MYCDDRSRHTASSLLPRSGRCVPSNSRRRSLDAKALDVLVYLGEHVLHGLEIAAGHVDHVPLDATAAGALAVVGEDAYGQLILSEQKRKGQYLKFYGKV